MKVFSIDFIPWNILSQNFQEKSLHSDINAIYWKTFAWRRYGEKCCLQAFLYFYRIQNVPVPVPKEVKVQLLGNAFTDARDSLGGSTRAAPREVDSATTIAAAAAAVIATAAPLLKVSGQLWEQQFLVLLK